MECECLVDNGTLYTDCKEQYSYTIGTGTCGNQSYQCHYQYGPSNLVSGTSVDDCSWENNVEEKFKFCAWEYYGIQDNYAWR